MSDKSKFSTKSAIFGGQMFAVAALFTIAAAGSAFAGTLTKTFEFGEGMAHTRSNVRTFPVPCGLAVVVTVKFARLGPDGANNNIPIKIELREPDTAPDQEGPSVESKSATATRTEQTLNLSSQGNNRGCNLPWRVRVKYALDGTGPFPTFGSIKFSFDDRTASINVESGVGGLLAGGKVSTYVGDVIGLRQGRIEITGTWFHVIRFPGGFVPGTSPVKLKFELLDPSGTVVKTAEGYSNNELRSELPKIKLLYQVPSYTSGRWLLRITNIDVHEMGGTNLSGKFTPGCP